MNDHTAQVWRDSVVFWNRAYALPEAERNEEAENVAADWQALAPSEKQLQAINELAKCEKLLDYGCGNGWASVIAAKAGCPSVTAVDVAENGVKGAKMLAEQYGAGDRIQCRHIPESWLQTEQPEKYDGFFSSNVLDVVPTEVAEEILAGAHRVLQKGARLVISLNYFMEPLENPERKITVQDGHLIFIDGILRLNSRTDDEWKALFEKYFRAESLEYYAWPGENRERRRLFRLIKG